MRSLISNSTSKANSRTSAPAGAVVDRETVGEAAAGLSFQPAGFALDKGRGYAIIARLGAPQPGADASPDVVAKG